MKTEQEQEQGNVQQDEINLTFMNKSIYDGYQSALVYLYRVSNTVMPDLMAKKLSQFMGGMRRTIVKSNEKCGQRLMKKREDEL